jgi:hypothetical protein
LTEGFEFAFRGVAGRVAPFRVGGGDQAEQAELEIEIFRGVEGVVAVHRVTPLRRKWRRAGKIRREIAGWGEEGVEGRGEAGGLRGQTLKEGVGGEGESDSTGRWWMVGEGEREGAGVRGQTLRGRRGWRGNHLWVVD